MSDLENKWGFTSGLPLADADVTIVAFEFGFNNQVGAGLICANITFVVDGAEDEPVDQSLTVGDGWDIAGKGASISGRTKLNQNSNWGRLAMSMVEAAGGPAGISEALPDADYREAAGWIGSRWHLGTVQVEVFNPAKKETKMSDKIVATAFLGVAGEDEPAPATKPATKAGTATATKPATTTAAKPAAGKTIAKPAKPTLLSTNPDLFAELLAIAMESEDHDTFMNAVMEREDVENDALALNAVMSATAASSVWVAREAAS